MAVTLTHLQEAQEAYHKLLTGRAVVRFRDQNGETVEYNQASRQGLSTYIEQLKKELGLLPFGSGPMMGIF